MSCRHPAERLSAPSLRPSPACAGFTLIELLVVVVIVGVLAGTIVLNVTDRGSQQRLASDASRFLGVVELARARALQRNREWGVVIGESSYGFVELADEGGWQWAPGDRFSERAIAEVELRLSVEGRQAALIDTLNAPTPTAGGEASDGVDRSSAPAPDLVLFSSGETTPFELELRPRDDLIPEFVISDGLNLRQTQDPDEPADREDRG